MGPSLHEWYTAAAAVASFGDARAAEYLCDGQFVVLPTAVLCLATLGDRAAGPYLGFPSSFVWRPGRPDYDPADEVPWLPTKARVVWGPNREKLKDHHLFLRAPGDERFLYAGTAHLGSWGDNRKPNGKEAGFSLNEKLSRAAWLHLGGYPGWRVEVNHREYFLDPADVEGFRRLAGDRPRRKFGHLSLTRYEEDSLTVHTNAGRGWLMYLRHPADSGLHTRDLNYSGDPDAEEFFECACGIDLEFPANQTLPREKALQVAVEFFRTGELPRGVAWEAGSGRF